jgi:hypothetical protein
MNEEFSFPGDDASSEPGENEMLVMQAQASSTLAAMASGMTEMVLAQIEDIWSKGCKEKVFFMATWVNIANMAVRSTGAEVTFAASTADGKIKSDLTVEDQVSETFMNLLSGAVALDGAGERFEQALDAMHDFLHEADEASAKSVFIAVLTATAQATRICIEATGVKLP